MLCDCWNVCDATEAVEILCRSWKYSVGCRSIVSDLNVCDDVKDVEIFCRSWKYSVDGQSIVSDWICFLCCCCGDVDVDLLNVKLILLLR